MYSVNASDKFKKKNLKLSKKSPKRYFILKKKIFEIVSEPKKYKHLRGDKQGLSRVHIDTHFVLTFKIDHFKKKVYFEDFDHHDKIYK